MTLYIWQRCTVQKKEDKEELVHSTGEERTGAVHLAKMHRSKEGSQGRIGYILPVWRTGAWIIFNSIDYLVRGYELMRSSLIQSMYDMTRRLKK